MRGLGGKAIKEDYCDSMLLD